MVDLFDPVGADSVPLTEEEIDRERARVRIIHDIGADVRANLERHRLYRAGLLTVADYPVASVLPPDPGEPPSVYDRDALAAWNARCEAVRVFDQAVADRLWLIRNPLCKGS